MRTTVGRTDRVVVVGAGLGGLACAIRLAAAGRDVTVIERAPAPGGKAGRLDTGGYTFDTGPTVLTGLDIIAGVFGAVGEDVDAWLDLIRLDPAYRAHFPDGSTLDVIADSAQMAGEVARVCGPREADGYLRFVSYARALWQLEREDFIERNLDRPRDLRAAGLFQLAAMGGFRRLSSKINSFFRDPRTRRVFSFQAMYAGLAPHEALALYAVIAYLDTIAGVYFPRGGLHALPLALTAVARRHGVGFRFGERVERVEVTGDRATAVILAEGQRVQADVVVLNPDLPAAYRDLLPAGERWRPWWLGPVRYAPSCVVLQLGATAAYSRIAHHNIHFGRTFRKGYDEVIHAGRLMSDPSLLVTNASRSDPTLAPRGGQTYCIVVPAPNLVSGARRGPGRRLDWPGGLADDYRAEIIGTLERRGYLGLSASIDTARMVTPADWAEAGMVAGTPFNLAHTMRQTGPFRPGTLHPTLDNVVFVGSGTQPGVGVPMALVSGRLAAERITGPVSAPH
ncbi:MAG: phytoene desaturase [Dactylosporangium sp.]|nr:phytoene desaturase [Dactylosporangium sp.]NNJ59722.1 phytoene desaturase [Dactylosporangium sp.]